MTQDEDDQLAENPEFWAMIDEAATREEVEAQSLSSPSPTFQQATSIKCPAIVRLHAETHLMNGRYLGLRGSFNSRIPARGVRLRLRVLQGTQDKRYFPSW